MKKLRNIITICCLLIAYVYFCNVYYFPSELIVKENSKIEFKLCPFIECIGVIQTDSNNDNTYKIELSIAGIKLKDSKVNIIEDTKLVPVGKMIGLKLYSSGIMIVGISEIEDINGVLRKSINENDIEEGDRILKVNGTTVENKFTVPVAIVVSEIKTSIFDTFFNFIFGFIVGLVNDEIESASPFEVWLWASLYKYTIPVFSETAVGLYKLFLSFPTAI